MGFVRTTGGLLQLEPFNHTRELYQDLARFARSMNHTRAAAIFDEAARKAPPASKCPPPKRLKEVKDDRDAFHPDLFKGMR